MSILITREYLKSLLELWKRNKISTMQVYETANDLMSKGYSFIDQENDGNDSVTNEVLAYLESIDMNLVTQEDIPACFEFLDTAPGRFQEGYRKWDNYLESINYEKRKKMLKGIEPYLV